MSEYLPETPPRPVTFKTFGSEIWRNVTGLWRSSSGTTSSVEKTASMSSGFAASGESAGGQGYTPPTVQIPTSPISLVVVPEVYFPPSGQTMGKLTVSWQAVYVDTAGTPMSGASYEVWGRPTNELGWRSLTTAQDAVITMLGFDAGSEWDIRVRAVSNIGVMGGWSETVTTELAVDDIPPPQPVAPTTESHLGALLIKWNGAWENEEDVAPVDFYECQIHYSMVDDFVPDNTTLLGTIPTVIGGSHTTATLEYDSEYFIKLVAVDYTGNQSPPSNPTSAIPRRLVGTDVVEGTLDLSRLDADSQQAITSAAGAADGKTTNYWSPDPPVAPTHGADFTVGDTWFDTDNDNAISRWDGEDWAPSLLSSEAFGEIDATKVTVSNLDAGNISTGTLDARRIGADTITVDKLNVLAKNAVHNFSAQNYASGFQPPYWTQSSSITIDKAQLYAAVDGAATRAVDTLKVAATNGNTQVLSDTFEINPQETYSVGASLISPNSQSTKRFGVIVYNEAMTNIGAYKYTVDTEELDTTLTTAANFWEDKEAIEWRRFEGIVAAAGSSKTGIATGQGVEHLYVFPPDAKYMRVVLGNNNTSPTYGDGTTSTAAYFYSPVVTKTSGGAISASNMTVGQLDAGQVSIVNLSADVIKSGKLSADLFDARSITAEKIQLGQFDSSYMNSTFGSTVNLESNPALANKADASDVDSLSEGIVDLEHIVSTHSNELNNRLSAFTFDPAVGATIRTGANAVVITGSKISLMSGTTEVAYITGTSLEITNASILDNIMIGDFVIDKEGDNTLIRYNS